MKCKQKRKMEVGRDNCRFLFLLKKGGDAGKGKGVTLRISIIDFC